MSISRRQFLGGAGTLVALPLLESLLPRSARSATSLVPQRFVTFYVPNGFNMTDLTPPTTGANYTLSPSLQPLQSLQSKFLYLSNMANLSATSGDPGDHGRGTGSFLTAVPVAESQNFHAGVSVDQLLAASIGAATRFPSLQLGIDAPPSAGTCDNAYSCAYTSCVSWADATTPLFPQIDPVAAFNRIFGGTDTSASASDQARRLHYRTSVLDAVSSQVQSLRGRMGSTDQQKLDQYFTGVRALELQLTRPISASCTQGTPPVVTTDRPTLVKQMSDLMVLAMQCDATRVITFMLANGQSNLVYSWLGHTTGHHDYTHNVAGTDASFAAITQINTWEMTMLAGFLQALSNTQEADGTTMLDNTLVYCSTEISDNFNHNHDGMPVILAGGGAGLVTPGRHYMYDPSAQPDFATLYLAILASFNAPAASFGRGYTQPLSVGLKA